MKKIFTALALIVSFAFVGMGPAQATESPKTVIPAWVWEEVSFIRDTNHTREQGVTDCLRAADKDYGAMTSDRVFNKHHREACLTEVNNRNVSWPEAPHTIAQHIQKLKIQKWKEWSAYHMAHTFKDRAVKNSTSPRFERDMSLCTMSYSARTDASFKARSDCYSKVIRATHEYV